MISFVKRIYEDFERKHLMVIAAGLAYYFLMSFLPAMLLFTALMAYLPLNLGPNGGTSFVSYVMPKQVISLFQDLMSRISPHRTGVLSFSIIASLWLTSKGFKGVIAGLDIVHNVQRPRRIWTNRILAFGLAFAVGMLLLLGTVLTLAGPAIEMLIARADLIHSLWLRLWPYIQWLLSAVCTFAAIEILYRWAPNIPVNQRHTIPGAVVATTMWLALSWALSYYFQHFGNLKLDVLYELLASPIALIVWLNWSAIAILVGAEINVNLKARGIAAAEPAKGHAPRSEAA